MVYTGFKKLKIHEYIQEISDLGKSSKLGT